MCGSSGLFACHLRLDDIRALDGSTRMVSARIVFPAGGAGEDIVADGSGHPGF
jgi:hypothetical protein